MLEFLKICGPNELYERAKDCELNLKSFNPYTPMASLFETTLKTEFYKYYPYERFNKKLDPSLIDLLGNDEFIDRYTHDFFFEEKEIEVIDRIRKESNRFKHRDYQKTKPSENDVRECFKCLFSFCAGIYKAGMSEDAPAWEDAEYDRLLANLMDNDKRIEEIETLRGQISILTSEVDTINSEKNEAYALADELRSRLTEEREKFADKTELEAIKQERDTLNRNNRVLKHNLAKSVVEQGNLKIKIDRVTRELKSSNKETVDSLTHEKEKLEHSYNRLCSDINSVNSENLRLKTEIESNEKKYAELTKKYEEACASADNSKQIIELNNRIQQLDQKIANYEDNSRKLLNKLSSNREYLSKISTAYAENSETFKEAAIRSAAQYYKYLDKYANQSGTGYTSQIVSDIKNASHAIPNRYWIYIEKMPFNIESILIKIDDRVYPPEDIKTIEIDRDNSRIKVELSNEIANSIGVDFNKISLSRVFVLSDMKFLVARVGKWYKSFGDNLHIPEIIKPIPKADFSILKDEPSRDQVEALNGILTQPFSYVWGAPGTGKTQFVLARAVLSYILAGKKVLVTAPTNNAVEQTLYGLLNVLEEAGVDYNKLVVRCGTASSSFAEKYPNVCENAEYSNRLMELQKIISDKHKEIEELDGNIKDLHDYDNIKCNLTIFEEITNNCSGLIPDLLGFAVKINGKDGLVKEYKDSINVSNNNIAAFEKDKSALELRVPKIRKKLDSKRLGIKLGLVNTDKLNSELLDLLRKINEYKELIQYTKDEIKTANKKISEAEDEYRKNSDNFISLKNGLIELLKPISDSECYSYIVKIKPSNASETIKKYYNTVDTAIASFRERITQYKHLDGKDISAYESEKAKCISELNEYQEEKNTVAKKVGEKDTSVCMVFAATIDNCITRFLPNDRSNQFYHVFLDEAAYASLIKGAILFSYGCPVTFLGDHMQLPPVCELDDETARVEQDYDMVPLWSQSALYAEDIFYETPNEIVTEYLDADPNKENKPKCRTMVKYDLTYSHRFGPALANVLAGTVYSKAFHGSDLAETKLFYIDAKRIHGKDKRQNQGEGLAIKQFVEDNRYIRKNSQTSSDNALGIITPYKNQAKQISSYFSNKTIKESIINVHRSQGKEWETVVFSATDKDDKFFTDSNKLIGKQIINTAVSRAKKNLIIVCDYDYWISQRGQLICDLLKVAEKIDVNVQYDKAVSYQDPYLSHKPKDIERKRLLRARNLIVEEHKNQYIVSGGNAVHSVRRKADDYECDCQDYLDGTTYCKHILAVMLKNSEIGL